MLKYPARRYDLQLYLRVSPLLWIIQFYGLRHLLFLEAPTLLDLMFSIRELALGLDCKLHIYLF